MAPPPTERHTTGPRRPQVRRETRPNEAPPPSPPLPALQLLLNSPLARAIWVSPPAGSSHSRLAERPVNLAPGHPGSCQTLCAEPPRIRQGEGATQRERTTGPTMHRQATQRRGGPSRQGPSRRRGPPLSPRCAPTAAQCRQSRPSPPGWAQPAPPPLPRALTWPLPQPLVRAAHPLPAALSQCGGGGGGPGA